MMNKRVDIGYIVQSPIRSQLGMKIGIRFCLLLIMSMMVGILGIVLCSGILGSLLGMISCIYGMIGLIWYSCY